MKLARVEIENYRAIDRLELSLDPNLTVLHGGNAQGKTSVLSAIAKGLGIIPQVFSGVITTDQLTWSDARGPGPSRVGLTAVANSTFSGLAWDLSTESTFFGSDAFTKMTEFCHDIVSADRNGTGRLAIPIVAYYDTDRVVLDEPPDPSEEVAEIEVRGQFPRFTALHGAMSTRTNFRDFFKWYFAKENEELREQKRREDFRHRLSDLEAVRRAVESMIPGASDTRIELRPRRMVVSLQLNGGEPEQLSIDQMSGGYRIMLALVADLARRMAQGNPHLDDPLRSEAVVLIDEIELHLHPSWQQRVLGDLARTFPNAQFVVSTHSPQVLTTVRPEHVVELRREGSGIVAEPASAPTYGAEAGDVLETVMGVDERPAGNEFAVKLAQYTDLVADGRGDSPEAVSLRKGLEKLSPRDPALDRADIEIRRCRLLRSMGKSP